MSLPAEVVGLTDEFLRCVDPVAPGLVTDLYLHGSLCWGEFFEDSDIDFVAVLGRAPTGEELDSLAQAHARVRAQFPDRRFEGFHCRRSDLDALLAFTKDNLKTYWGSALGQLDGALDEQGPAAVGGEAGTVGWVTLGVARIHHLLVRREVTSKSGAGRYVLGSLDPRWHPLAADALAIRERPGSPSAYDDVDQRGQDLRDFLAWAVEDGGDHGGTQP